MWWISVSMLNDIGFRILYTKDALIDKNNVCILQTSLNINEKDHGGSNALL